MKIEYKMVLSRAMIQIDSLNKVYGGGFHALKDVSLEIRPGEIFALLGPNGAGKTTLIGTICGIVRPTSGQIRVGGFDVQREYRKTRSMIGLVPQELSTDAFEKVLSTVQYSRGLFGRAPNPGKIEALLKQLSLWEKRHQRIMTLSGGMKRRLMIAKALSHEPSVLFLDEPSAGVDVELRREMWKQVHELREQGVTIVLTTHYIEEAEEMADRVGVMSQGRLLLVEEKSTLMKKLGKKELRIELHSPLGEVPSSLEKYQLQLGSNGKELIYRYDKESSDLRMGSLLESLRSEGLLYRDLQTKQSSLEEIFVHLVQEHEMGVSQ